MTSCISDHSGQIWTQRVIYYRSLARSVFRMLSLFILVAMTAIEPFWRRIFGLLITQMYHKVLMFVHLAMPCNLNIENLKRVYLNSVDCNINVILDILEMHDWTTRVSGYEWRSVRTMCTQNRTVLKRSRDWKSIRRNTSPNSVSRLKIIRGNRLLSKLYLFLVCSYF